MIVTRSPLRISLLGGGTDIPEFFMQESTCIFGGSINQYVYVVSNNLSKFSTEKYRFTYRITESVLNSNDFQHPVVRSALARFSQVTSINLTTFSDVPGRTGLGSSSAFTVALLGNLHELIGSEKLTPKELALEAVDLERRQLKEAGGIQDQFHSSVGGLRFYDFFKNDVKISKNFYNSKFFEQMNKSMVIVRVGKFRNSKQIHFSGVKKNINEKILGEINSISKFFRQNFNPDENNIDLISECINESWNLKKALGQKVTSDEIDNIIDIGLAHGAKAAKLCGAGESGFVLFVAPPETLGSLLHKFGDEKCQKVEFIKTGFETINNSDRWQWV